MIIQYTLNKGQQQCSFTNMKSVVLAIVFLAFKIIYCFPEATGPRPKVQAKFGKIIGKSFSFDGGPHLDVVKTVDGYLSIPYAEPPVGPLRFMPPIAKTWSAEEGQAYDASINKAACPQMKLDYFNFTEEITEDCLHLDVYTPHPTPTKAPVMVFIHGGGFVYGTGTTQLSSPVPIVAVGDVIVVNINYRLNVFGFFSTGDNVVSGNAGLKDQVLALKWVHEHIADFGGDPESVTIFGESAGGMSVTYHVISPMSRGLFNGAIMQSGTIVGGVQLGPETRRLQRKRALALGKTFGCEKTNTSELVECLQAVDFETLLANYTNTNVETGEHPMTNPFSPNSDGEFLSDRADSLFENPANIIEANVMLGELEDEGNVVLPMVFPSYVDEAPIVNQTDFDMVVDIMTIKVLPTELSRKTTKLFYLTDDHITDPTADRKECINQLIGDIWFTCPNTRAAKYLVSAGNDVYTYHWTQVPSKSLWKVTWLGATHAEDLSYVFGSHFNEHMTQLYGGFTTEDIMLTKNIITYWTNFAKTGNPNSAGNNSTSLDFAEWPKYTLSDQSYKEIKTGMPNGKNIKPQVCEYFNEILPRLIAMEEKLKDMETEERGHCTKESCDGSPPIARPRSLYCLRVRLDCLAEKDGPQPMVQAKFGKVLGKSVTIGPDDYLKEAKTVDAYLSIPYAEPPVASLRFMSPVAKSWGVNTVFEATGPQTCCFQPGLDILPIYEEMSEDCLHLDVYTPNPRPVNAPVMVFIHGGGFVYGIGTSTNMSQVPMAAIGDVIVVNINYRLNVFGFFSTGDDVVPGNMGFKDQVLALQWVHNNIAEFGGDPEMITIYGESAGSISVTYHIVSPMSKGLFHRAIMQSGTQVPHFHGELNSMDLQRSRAFSFGRTLGCNQKNTKELVECLQTVDRETLLANYSVNTAIENEENPLTNVFIPNADGEFMPDDTSVLFDTLGAINDVDVLLGTVADEGTIFIKMLNQGETFNRTDFDMFVSVMLYMQLRTEVTKKTASILYLSDEQISHPESDHRHSASQMMGDLVFVCPAEKTAQQLAAAGKNVFLYQMTHVPSRSFWNMTGLGAAHGDDLIYVLGMHYNEDLTFMYGQLPDEEIRLTKAMITYWSNFAKTGDPNNSGGKNDFISAYPQWPKFSHSEHSYKKISTTMRNDNNLKTKECRFFNDIFPQIVKMEEKLNKFESEERHEKIKYTCQSDSCDGENP
ncbi:uncharacterized protein LOC117124450 [Anneissia japonica]|uniref:uncharacterized protein LOC117124450 n=1 Tax=Anneissia japonica TaxID=1529436 RepID=UPI00142593EE|nr:uncharacterized protein LOC117124450 [Anneissia japonica]